MREISVNVIKDIIKDSCLSLSCVYPEDVYKSLVKGYEEEVDTNAKIAMNMLIDNAKIAKEESIPICQDTGMVSLFLSVGQEVHLVDGDVNEAKNIVNEKQIKLLIDFTKKVDGSLNKKQLDWFAKLILETGTIDELFDDLSLMIKL